MVVHLLRYLECIIHKKEKKKSIQDVVYLLSSSFQIVQASPFLMCSILRHPRSMPAPDEGESPHLCETPPIQPWHMVPPIINPLYKVFSVSISLDEEEKRNRA